MENLEINLKNNESHLFRHASEITKETKGGYLSGHIKIPKLNYPCCLIRFSLVPAQINPQGNPFNTHPLLIHMNFKLDKKIRQQDIKEGNLPEDVDWCFTVYADLTNGAVHHGTDKVKPRFPYSRKEHVRLAALKRKAEPTGPGPQPGEIVDDPSILEREETLKAKSAETIIKIGGATNYYCQGDLNLPPNDFKMNQKLVQMKSAGDNWVLNLGSQEFMMNIITPLQKYTNGGVTVCDVLRQRHMDLNGWEMSSSLLKSLENHFYQDRVRLQQVRILAEIFIPMGGSNTWMFQCSNYSDIITNSKSKECGPIRLHDVIPNSSCSKGGARICLLSHFKLMPDVRARFIIWDPKAGSIVNNVTNDILKQPSVSSVFNQYVITFDAPEQNMQILDEHIYSKGYTIRVTAWRPSDHRLSSISFEFRYFQHNSVNIPEGFSGLTTADTCFICFMRTFKQDTPKLLPPARPGQVRRDEKTIFKYDPVCGTVKEVGSAPSKDAKSSPKRVILEQTSPTRGTPGLLGTPVTLAPVSRPVTSPNLQVVDVANEHVVIKKEPGDIFAQDAPHDVELGPLVIKEEPTDDMTSTHESISSLHLTIPVPPPPKPSCLPIHNPSLQRLDGSNYMYIPP